MNATAFLFVCYFFFCIYTANEAISRENSIHNLK